MDVRKCHCSLLFELFVLFANWWELVNFSWTVIENLKFSNNSCPIIFLNPWLRRNVASFFSVCVWVVRACVIVIDFWFFDDWYPVNYPAIFLLALSVLLTPSTVHPFFKLDINTFFLLFWLSTLHTKKNDYTLLLFLFSIPEFLWSPDILDNKTH